MTNKRRITERIRILTPEQAALAGVWMSLDAARVEIAKKRSKGKTEVQK